MIVNYADSTVTASQSPAPQLCQHCQRVLAGRGIKLDRASHRAWWRGVDLNLTRGEYRLTQHLVDAAPRFVKYQELYDALRQRNGFACGDTSSNIRSAIKRLRRKFAAADPAFRGIANYNGHGYRWEAE